MGNCCGVSKKNSPHSENGSLAREPNTQQSYSEPAKDCFKELLAKTYSAFEIESQKSIMKLIKELKPLDSEVLEAMISEKRILAKSELKMLLKAADPSVSQVLLSSKAAELDRCLLQLQQPCVVVNEVRSLEYCTTLKRKLLDKFIKGNSESKSQLLAEFGRDSACGPYQSKCKEELREALSQPKDSRKVTALSKVQTESEKQKLRARWKDCEMRAKATGRSYVLEILSLVSIEEPSGPDYQEELDLEAKDIDIEIDQRGEPINVGTLKQSLDNLKVHGATSTRKTRHERSRSYKDSLQKSDAKVSDERAKLTDRPTSSPRCTCRRSISDLSLTCRCLTKFSLVESQTSIPKVQSNLEAYRAPGSAHLAELKARISQFRQRLDIKALSDNPSESFNQPNSPSINAPPKPSKD